MSNLLCAMIRYACFINNVLYFSNQPLGPPVEHNACQDGECPDKRLFCQLVTQGRRDAVSDESAAEVEEQHVGGHDAEGVLAQPQEYAFYPPALVMDETRQEQHTDGTCKRCNHLGWENVQCCLCPTVMPIECECHDDQYGDTSPQSLHGTTVYLAQMTSHCVSYSITSGGVEHTTYAIWTHHPVMGESQSDAEKDKGNNKKCYFTPPSNLTNLTIQKYNISVRKSTTRNHNAPGTT